MAKGNGSVGQKLPVGEEEGIEPTPKMEESALSVFWSRRRSLRGAGDQQPPVEVLP